MQLIEHDAAFGEVFNIGGIEEISILDLARKIVTATNSSSEIQMIPYDQAFGKDFEDMQRRVPSLEKIKRLIGFNPQTQLDAILSKVVAYMRTNPDNS